MMFNNFCFLINFVVSAQKRRRKRKQLWKRKKVSDKNKKKKNETKLCCFLLVVSVTNLRLKTEVLESTMMFSYQFIGDNLAVNILFDKKLALFSEKVPKRTTKNEQISLLIFFCPWKMYLVCLTLIDLIKRRRWITVFR